MKIYAIPLIKENFGYYCSTKAHTTGMLSKGINYANNKWEEMSASKSDSFKFKLYKWGLGIMDKMDHKEWFLKSIPDKRDCDTKVKLLILHPSAIQPIIITKNLSELASSRVLFHKKFFYYSLIGLPFTSLFSILPLPNVPFFYNAFRVYSHYKAFHGAKHLNALFKEKRVITTKDEKIDRHMYSLKDNIEDKEGKIKAYIDQDTIKWMAKDLELPHMEVEINRALKQEVDSMNKKV